MKSISVGNLQMHLYVEKKLPVKHPERCLIEVS